ncbi:uncharacterized protein DNG_01193 [Cephalotrichum gorgonifer]|uniref:Thioesterase domain-containing protein n=1 Tax=Cephalotrichum gorgonifer TaxID=2041049 RepID=A0AAE8SRG4_9PEZI|nr:uncharacterized protein DNG_01193 [Cephalotrichum gorgonifer]
MAPKKYVQDTPDVERYLKATGEEKIKMWLSVGEREGGVAGVLVPKPFNVSVIPFVTYISSSATPTPRASFHYTVQKSHCNTIGNLSGGAAATLLDYLTTLPICLVNSPSWIYLGISRNLSLTFLQPAPLGETVRVDCEVLGIGKRMATIRAEIKREADGTVLVVAEHSVVSISAGKA